jgi:hypothetical protein
MKTFRTSKMTPFTDYWNAIGSRQPADILPEDFARRAWEAATRHAARRQDAEELASALEALE